MAATSSLTHRSWLRRSTTVRPLTKEAKDAIAFVLTLGMDPNATLTAEMGHMRKKRTLLLGTMK